MAVIMLVIEHACMFGVMVTVMISVAVIACQTEAGEVVIVLMIRMGCVIDVAQRVQGKARADGKGKQHGQDHAENRSLPAMLKHLCPVFTLSTPTKDGPTILPTRLFRQSGAVSQSKDVLTLAPAP